MAVGTSSLFGSARKGVSYRFSGGRWSAGPTSAFDLFAVSCATANFCGAVDNLKPHGHGYLYNGKSWSAPTTIGGGYADAISCPTTTFCAVLLRPLGSTLESKVVYYRDGRWSKAVLIDPSGSLASVSCASANFCVAVDENGNAVTDINGKWSRPVAVSSGASLGGVSCPTRTFCMAVSPDGSAASYNGSRWSSFTISAHVDFTSVSCPTTSFCAAAGETSPFSNGTPTVYVAIYRSSS